MTPNWPRLRLGALWLWHQLITVGLVGLVLLALWVGVGRQLMPFVAERQAALEARLSAAAGVPVRMAALSGRWEGLGPVFEVQGLAVHDPQPPEPPLLTVPQLEIRPALWRSLRSFSLRLDIRARGLALALDQLPDGRLQVRELRALGARDPAALRRVLALALDQPALAISDSRLQLALHGRPALELAALSLINQNAGDRHRLGGDFRLGTGGPLLRFDLDYSGDVLDWRQGRLAAWVHLPPRVLDAWLPAAEVAGVGLVAATAGGDFWLRFERGALVGLQAVPWVQSGRLRTPQGEHQLTDLRGRLDWRQTAAGWQLALAEAEGRLDGVALRLPALGLRQTDEQLWLTAQRLPLGQWQPVLPLLGLPPPLVHWWQQAAPAGELSALALGLARTEEGWQPQQLRLKAAGLAARATDRWPGIDGLSGWLDWTPAASWLGLQMADGRLDLPQIFREPVAVTRLSGALHLQRDGAGWALRSSLLQGRNDDARGQAVLALRLPPDASPEIALRARLHEGRAASAWRYVPWHGAGDATLDWLRRAIVGGRVTTGDFLFSGPVHPQPAGEPFVQHMRFAVEDATLDYQPGWPALRALDATVGIDGRALWVEGHRARLYDGTEAFALRADIPDLHLPALAVRATLASQGPDLMRVFADSPLAAHTAGIARAMVLEGPVTGQLQLALPLTSRLPPGTQVAVQARLPGNTLRLPGAGLVAEAVAGEVSYDTARGLVSAPVAGRLLGAPVTARLASEMRSGALAAVNVDIEGRASVPALRAWLGESPLWAAADGASDYRAQVRVPADGATRLVVESALQGLRLRLPAPLDKTAAESWPLRYQGALGGERREARVVVGNRLAAALGWRGDRLAGGSLRVGGGEVPVLDAEPGWRLDGRLPVLDVADWQPWAARLRAPASASLPALREVQLEVGELRASGWRLPAARLAAQREGAGWQVQLATADLEAALDWPDADGALAQLALRRLRWPLVAASGDEAAATALPTLTRPIQLSVARLQLAQWPGMGEWRAEARLAPSPYGLRIDNLQVAADSLAFDGRLDWQWRGGVSSRLRGTVTSGDVARLLRGLGYAPTLQSPRARAELDLGWPGSPAAFAVAGLRGEFLLDVEDGRLLNITTVTSASRVFGLLDLDNWRRRFKGDFSDVLQRGLAFDRASLRGEVSDGMMPAAVFQLAGPSLNAAAQGSLDLARQQLDQQLVVSMPVSSAVPLAAAVVGGPLVGGAVAAAEAALKKQLEKATLLRYHVSGAWEDVQVERHTRKLPGLDGLLVKSPPTAQGKEAAP